MTSLLNARAARHVAVPHAAALAASKLRQCLAIALSARCSTARFTTPGFIDDAVHKYSLARFPSTRSVASRARRVAFALARSAAARADSIVFDAASRARPRASLKTFPYVAASPEAYARDSPRACAPRARAAVKRFEIIAELSRARVARVAAARAMSARIARFRALARFALASRAPRAVLCGAARSSSRGRSPFGRARRRPRARDVARPARASQSRARAVHRRRRRVRDEKVRRGRRGGGCHPEEISRARRNAGDEGADRALDGRGTRAPR